MYINSLIAKAITISFVLALAGCGGDSSSDITPTPQPPPKPESKLLALDGFSTVKPGTKTRVNLSPFVRGDNVQIVSANVVSSDTHCGIPTIDGTSLDITAGDGAYCSYSYLAQSGDIQSYAQLRVLATDADVPMLPPLSQAMVLGSSNLSLNLETLLGSDWPTGYQLNSSSVNVQGSEGNLGSIVSTTGNTIIYKGPELSGWNRLVYTISNLAKPGEDKMGVVYITVSEEVNQPPIIGVPKYPYQFAPKAYDKEITSADIIDCTDVDVCPESSSISAIGSSRNLFWLNKGGARNIILPVGAEYDGRTVTIQTEDLNRTTIWNGAYVVGFVQNLGGRVVFNNFNGYWWAQNSFTEGSAPGFIPNDTIYAGETVTLDLSQLHGLNIREPDNQEWQLIDVQSYSATVTPTNPNSVTNKSFNFNAGTVGEHYVSYIIADHFGGYAAGIIEIDVSAKGGAPTWVDIKAGGNTYLAPQTYDQAIAAGYAVTDIWDNGVNNTLAGYRQQTANSYCNSVGTLPTEAEMDVLRNANISGSSLTGELAKWPVQQSYIVKSGDGVATYDLISGSTQVYNDATQNYVTCLKKTTGMSLTVNNYKVVANGERVSFAMVRMPSAADTFRLDKLAGSLSESDVDFQLGKKVDATTEITTQSTKVGTYSFSVTDSKDPLATVTSSTIRYIGDSETGKFEPTTGLVIKTNNATPDGISENRLVATLTDINDNPIEGERLNIEITENGDANDSAKYTFNPVSGRTNDKGQLEIKITNTEKETVDVRAVFVRPIDGVEEYSDTAKISYFNSETYPCHGVKGDYDCLPVQEQRDKEGWLFTPSASNEFSNSSGLTDYLKAYGVENYSFKFDGPGTYGIYDLWVLSIRNDFSYYEHQCKFLNIEGHAGRKNWRRALATEMWAFAKSNIDPNNMEAWPGFSRRKTGNTLVYSFAGVTRKDPYGLTGSIIYSNLPGMPGNRWDSYVEHALIAEDYYGYMCVSPPA
ncbi:Ig-like domain-containing protein [Photobacterium leiognathi]|uniref:Ig-like domain-containing protein n=1 Tax=Photobacterium leiognathi TaxID=553611 RepID=UPI00298293F6|nr:Ig-like domain-containing protein [Photobacterium leiognathi]